MNAAKKKGLGRGLSALFGDIENKSKSNQIQTNQIPIADLQQNKYQPRTIFDEEKLIELSSSIKENGVIQPIAVRPNKYEPGKYEIVAGERRWLAAQKAGLTEIPAVILNIDDQKSLEIAIVENVQRQDLNVIEEAKGYERLIKEFGYDHEKIARFMSKSRSHISNTLRLLTLPKDVIGMIEEGSLSAGQARPLIGLPSATNIAEEVVAKNLSSRSVEILVRQKKGPQKASLYKTDANILSEQNKIQDNLGLNVKVIRESLHPKL